MLRSAPSSRIALAAAPRRFESSITSAPGTVPAAPRTTNEPDYNIKADKATSYANFVVIDRHMTRG